MGKGCRRIQLGNLMETWPIKNAGGTNKNEVQVGLSTSEDGSELIEPTKM